MNKKLIVFGTRPEFIKLIPIILEIKKQELEKDYLTVFTGQHHELTENLFEEFSFVPDISIPFVNEQNSLGFSFSSILNQLQEIVYALQKKYTLKLILAQGDTTSCACAAFCAFLNSIPFAHVEAGLRTNCFESPFPEEYFRHIITLSSSIHFAPTETAVSNLLKEGVKKENIQLTGNTIVDMVEFMQLTNNFKPNAVRDKILITCHRRENQNWKFHDLVNTVKILAQTYPNLKFIWITHKTPFVKNELVSGVFENYPTILISAPLSLSEMYRHYTTSKLIITDSGGIQEEACSFSVPVLVIRDATERKESIALGYSFLTQNVNEDLIRKFNEVLNAPPIFTHNPYGEGNSAKKIVAYLNNN